MIFRRHFLLFGVFWWNLCFFHCFLTKFAVFFKWTFYEICVVSRFLNCGFSVFNDFFYIYFLTTFTFFFRDLLANMPCFFQSDENIPVVFAIFWSNSRIFRDLLKKSAFFCYLLPKIELFWGLWTKSTTIFAIFWRNLRVFAIFCRNVQVFLRFFQETSIFLRSSDKIWAFLRSFNDIYGFLRSFEVFSFFKFYKTITFLTNIMIFSQSFNGIRVLFRNISTKFDVF